MNLKPRFGMNFLSVRIILLVALCALVVFAIFSESDIMSAQQSSGPRATVRHGFTVNGRIEGSVQQLTGEATTLNGGGVLTGDLLVPGTPTVRLNGNPTFGGTVAGSGSTQPSNYQITLNGNARLGRLVTRTDPTVMPTVPAPPSATGTRDVTLNNSSQSPGNFATLRDLTLNGNVGNITVPPGTYRKFTANGGSGFVLGISGATQPAVYNFNSLLLNSSSQLQIVGPVVLTSATAVTLNAAMGSAGNPLWLSLKVATGGVTLNGGSSLYAAVTAPSGLVTINGNSSLIGNVICDRLIINGNGLLRMIQGDTTAPVVTIQQPAEGAFTNAAQVTVNGTYNDDSQTTITVNGVSATLSGNSFTATVPVAEGQNSLLIAATDAAGNRTEVRRQVVRDTTAPGVAIQQPIANSVTNSGQVTVSGNFNDATATTVKVNNANATVSGNSFTATVPLVEGVNGLNVVAIDAAGNQGTASRNLIRDTAVPTIAISQPSDGAFTKNALVTVTGTYSDATATTITINGVAATLSGSNFTAVVSLSEGANSLHAVAIDAAQNTNQATRSITLDTAAPAIAVEQPSGAFTNKTQIDVTGTVADASATTVTVNGAAATMSGNSFTANVALNEGANVLHISASDAAGNLTEVDRSLTRDTVAPIVTIQSPADGILTAGEEAIVAGTFSDASSVTVTVNSVPAILTQNSYTATVPLSDGPSLLIATAVDAAGNETEVERKITKAGALSLSVQEPLEGQLADSGEIRVAGSVTGTNVQVTVNGQPLTMVGATSFGGYTTVSEGSHTVLVRATDVLGRTEEAMRTVVVDTTPPTITEVVPAANALVSQTSTTVSGRVTDATAVTVKVNDVAASVGADGVFTLANFAVSEGSNAIRIEAIDALGQNTIADSVFLGKDRTAPTAPFVFPVSTETKFQSQQIEGLAEPGTLVSINGGSEPMTAQAAEGTGLFFATVNLAPGNNVLTVTAIDAEQNLSPAVVVTINSNPNLTRAPGEPVQIYISTNDAQKGLINQELPRPLIVRVTDQAGEPAAGVAVTYSAVFGGGSFVGGGNQFVAVTDSQGHASARYLGGTTPGFQYIRADFQNNPTAPVSFSAELLESTPGAPTTATGTVMDQNLRALPNVLVRLGGQQTRTAADGKFLLANVATGPHQVLELVGRDQIPLPGRWPNISYDFDVLAGVDNNLGRPLFLPRVNGGVAMPLDANNIITTDTVYNLPTVGGLPPIRVTARAGTHVTFPPDVTDKRLSVTRIPVNRTPMTLEDGRAASLYISVQPSGAIFEPALEISFPNLDNLPANEEVLLMSFDHDAGRYVQMGTGHVSADGSVVQSDSGSGIRVGAWHALPPRPAGGPSGSKETTILSEVLVAGNPALEGKDVKLKSAVALSFRGVEYSHVNNASGQLQKLLVRVLATMSGAASPVVETEVVVLDTAKPEIQIDAGAFDFKTKELFIAEDKEIKLSATTINGAAGSTYTITCTKPDQKKVMVTCDPKTGDITIKGSQVWVKNGQDYDNNAGETEFEVEAKGSLGGNAKKAKIKVSLVSVRYKEDKPSSGFDDPIRGKIQDASKVTFDPQNNFKSDVFKDDDPNNKLNKIVDPWLTTVLNYNQGQQTAKYEVKPDKAKDHLKFESEATAKADVTADIPNKKITVTGKTSSGTNQNKADETFVKAKVDSYKFDDTWQVGKLNVVVRKKVDVKLAFYFLLNPEDDRKPTLDPDDLDHYLERINNVLTPQTGVSYSKFRVYHWKANKTFNVVPAATNPAVLTRDFTEVVSALDWIYLAVGTGVNPNLPGTKGAAQAKLCDADADREVFVVWEFEETEVKPPTTDVVGAFTDGHGTVILDKEDTDNTLTHELGHSLYIQPFDTQYVYFNCLKGKLTCHPDPQHSNVQRELMFATNSGRSGTYIPKADVDFAIKYTTNSDWFKGGIKKRPC